MIRMVRFSIFVAIVAISVISCSASEDFESFHKRFFQDSTFQVSRVAFPIHGEYVTNDIINAKNAGDSTATSAKVWTISNWDRLYHDFDTTEYSVTITTKKSDVTEIIKGKTINLLVEIHYVLKNAKWFLVYLKMVSL